MKRMYLMCLLLYCRNFNFNFKIRLTRRFFSKERYHGIWRHTHTVRKKYVYVLLYVCVVGGGEGGTQSKGEVERQNKREILLA